MFPVITHIDQILPLIKDRKGFDVNHKEYDGLKYTSINYRSIGNPIDMFPDDESETTQLLKECRGIKFYEDGTIAARPFHKFFNYGERTETRDIDFSQPHVVQEKYDGSMIFPLFNKDKSKYYLCTKAGVTDVSLQCSEWLKTSSLFEQYNNFIFMCEKVRLTPIFEFVSPFNRIVVPYDKTELILLAIRNKKIGDYMHIYENQFDIPIRKTYDSFSHEAIEHLKKQEGVEGVVIQFSNQKFLKVKCDQYCLLHKGKESISLEKNVLQIILEGSLDDLIPLLQGSDLERVMNYEKTLSREIIDSNFTIQRLICQTEIMDSRKDVALYVLEKLSKLNRKELASVFWKCYDNKEADIMDEIVSFMLKKCSRQSSVDSIRNLIGGEFHAQKLEE